MERLTKRSEDTKSTMVWFVDKEKCDMRYEPCEMDSSQRRKLLCKLADYEDAEEQGLLLRLPKSMHDIDKNVIEYALVMAINLSRYGVDVGDKVESATELSYCLNQAYMRGRQDEIYRMTRYRDEAEQVLA